MSDLIECAACGAAVSKNAKSCPHCGEPGSRRRGAFRPIWYDKGPQIFLAMIAAIMVTAFMLSEENQTEYAVLTKDEIRIMNEELADPIGSGLSLNNAIIVKAVNLQIEQDAQIYEVANEKGVLGLVGMVAIIRTKGHSCGTVSRIMPVENSGRVSFYCDQNANRYWVYRDEQGAVVVESR